MMLPRPPNVQGSNPVEKDRQSTDKQACFLFSFIPILWFVIGMYSILHSNESTDLGEKSKAMKEAKSVIAIAFKSARSNDIIASVIVLFLITAFMWGFLYFFLKCTELCMGGILVLSTYCLYLLGSFIISLVETDAGFFGIIVAFEWFFPFFISMIAVIPSLCIIGINPTSGIIKNSCRVVVNNPSLIPIFGLFMVFEYLLLVFMLEAIVTVLLSDRNEIFIVLLFLLNFYGGTVMLSIVSKFGRMVLSEYSVNYYWENDEQPRIGESIALIGRCHIGTIMISSTWLIPYFCAIVQAIKHIPAWEKKENNFFYFISKILLVWQMHGKVLIFTSIYGTDYLQSSRKALDSVLRRCKLYLATTWMTQNNFFSLKYLVYILFGGLYDLYDPESKSYEDLREKLDTTDSKDQFIIYNYLTSLALYAPLSLVMSSIFTVAEALLINQIIISNNQD